MLLSKAFPAGIEEHEYVPLIILLYEHMSDRNLAEIVSLFIGKNYEEVYNDVLFVGGNKTTISLDSLNIVRNKLLNSGFNDWIQED